MQTFNTICSWRSIRKYTGEPMTEKEMDGILEAAYAAPIEMGAYDSLILTVITNRELLDEIDRNGARFLNA